MPFISLVVSTKGRRDELLPLLHSLERQTFQDFDVILVDQNLDNQLNALLTRDWGFPLTRYARPGDRGLSRGRNVGWAAAQGKFVAFPDDDCWYEPDFLAYAVKRLAETQTDVLTGRAVDDNGRSINGRFATRGGQVCSPSQVWTTQIEWVAFFRRTLLETLEGYDVDVGIGAATPWQACEGQDIVLRALKGGAVCWYDPDLTGRHAEILLNHPDPSTVAKGRSYGRGMGHVLRKHRFGVASLAYWISRPLVRAILQLLTGKTREARYYTTVALGRAEGALGRLAPDQRST